MMSFALRAEIPFVTFKGHEFAFYTTELQSHWHYCSPLVHLVLLFDAFIHLCSGRHLHKQYLTFHSEEGPNNYIFQAAASPINLQFLYKNGRTTTEGHSQNIRIWLALKKKNITNNKPAIGQNKVLYRNHVTLRLLYLNTFNHCE